MKTAEHKTGEVTRILIVDDHQIVRDGLKQMLLSLKKELDVQVAEAASGEKALQYLGHEDADLLIIDYRMEGMNGAETITRIRRFKPGIKILAISNYNEYELITAMMNAGALGYVLKSIQPAALLTAIQTVMLGKKYYCNEAALVMIAAAEDPETTKKLAAFHLSARELEILRLIGKGLTNVEIAQKIFVTRRTVDTHRQNLLRKMRVRNSAALIKLAAEMNLFK